ncbi:MAG: hypothetical protein U5K79_04585 [Cyclobacteriaceae bacterium]|nr:hypothetical protein [Cyclobacteriaceae bacterium]
MGLILLLKNARKTKVIYIAGYLLFTFLLGYLNLWKVSVARFIERNNNEMSAVINHLHEDFNDCEFKILGNGKCRINNDCDTSRLDIGLIHNLKSKIGGVEIDKNKELVLFTLSRFIDNGYGIAWINEENVEKIKIEPGTESMVLKITSLVNIKDNWYYISFT